MHIFKYFKCFTIQIFSKFKYDVPHISIYFLSPISKYFSIILKNVVPWIYLNISNVSQFKYFSKFKYDVPYIYIYFLSPISKSQENITYFYIFSLSFLNLRSRTNKSTKYSIQII
jgi:hypothetical protein